MKNKDVFKNICPLISSYLYFENNNATFLLPNKLIILEHVDKDLLLEVCKKCNGFNTVNSIVKNVRLKNYKSEEIAYLIQKMLDAGIIIDVHEYFSLFHNVSSNPMPFVKKINKKQLREMFKAESPLLNPLATPQTETEIAINNRVSTRKFSKNTMNENDFLRLMWFMYGKIDRSNEYPDSNIGFGTIPSGGALYPVRIRTIILKRIGNYDRGIYEIKKGKLIYLRGFLRKKLEDSFFGKQPFLENSFMCVVIGSDFKATTQKYSNRGYRYSLLEAGHVAQNAYIWSTENNIGLVEVCGFSDERLSRLIGFSYPRESALTTIFFGGL